MRDLFFLMYALVRRAVDHESAFDDYGSDPGELRFKAVLVLTFLAALVVIGADTCIALNGGRRLLAAASKPQIVAGFLGMYCVNYTVAVRLDGEWRDFDRRFRALPPASRRRAMLVGGAALASPLAFMALAYAALASR